MLSVPVSLVPLSSRDKRWHSKTGLRANAHYVLNFLVNVSVSRLIKMETLHDCYSEPHIPSPEVLLALLVRGLNHGV